jgi:opacity protein-like surface antigen
MKKQVVLALAALALSGAAAAQTYGVISVGGSDHDLGCGGATVCDESGTAFKLLGGYRFAPNLAFEGGYMSYGKSKARDDVLGIGLDTTVNGFGIGAAFHHDFTPTWNFVARLGLAQMKAKLKATSGGLTGSDSDSSAQLYGGLGVGYKLNKQMSIDAAWDFSRAEYSGEKLDVNAYSIGLTFAF